MCLLAKTNSRSINIPIYNEGPHTHILVFQFNLRENEGATNNYPVTRQPSPFLYKGLEVNHDYKKNMEKASLLAKRDIRLGNFHFNEDDLDLVPVKERKGDNAQKKASNRVSSPEKSLSMVHGSFSPGRSLVNYCPKKAASPKKNSVLNKPWKQKDSPENIVNIPTAGTENVPKDTTKRSLSIIIDNLLHAYNDLKKPTGKKGYPDDIEQDRLQRRVEEQRRHLYRMLYNTKRHVSQLVMQLERTASNHRKTVLNQSNIMCHLNTAYRSLMSGLNSFIRVSQTLHSTYMTELKSTVRTELSLLLKELKSVCNLMNIQIATLESSPMSSPAVPRNDSNAQPTSPVQKLNIGDKTKNVPEGPLSPERNESLKAAVKSLVTAELSKKHYDDVKQRSAHSVMAQQKIMYSNKKVSKNKPVKVIRPKSTSNARKFKDITSNKRPVSANTGKGKRALGDIDTNRSGRPISAPCSASPEPLEIHGNITPFITEREMARQAWIDELGTSRPIFTEVNNPIEVVQTPVKQNNVPTEIGKKELCQSSKCDTTMVQLLYKLEEIEKEDEEIRSRWLHIQYSDPQKQSECDKSHVVLPSANLLEPVTGIITSVHSTCFRTELAELKVIQRHRILEIESYKDSMLQYLRLTKNFKTERFDPWATINNIVDGIINDLVGEVCNEITYSCDSLASNIYLSEFLPA